MEQTLGNIYVVAGPTAVGKGTVVRHLRERYPDLPLSISVTTRPPRPGEVDGADYRFVSEEEFDQLVSSDALLEWAYVHQKHRYGTLKAWVEEQVRQGDHVVLEVDLEGARQIKERVPDAVTVFILPPSWDHLVRRLVGRGTEGREEQSRRLETAKREIAAQDEFDWILVNDEVDRTAEELASILGLN